MKKFLIGVLSVTIIVLVILILRLNSRVPSLDTPQNQPSDYNKVTTNSSVSSSGVDSPSELEDQDLQHSFTEVDVATYLNGLKVAVGDEKTITFNGDTAYVEEGINHYSEPVTVTLDSEGYLVSVGNDSYAVTESQGGLVVECDGSLYKVEVTK